MRLTYQQPILWRNVGGNQLRPDPVPLLLQLQCSHDIDRQRTIDPPRKIGIVIDIEVVATRQDRDTGARGRRAIEYDVAEIPARMQGDDDVTRTENHVLQARGDEGDTAR